MKNENLTTQRRVLCGENRARTLGSWMQPKKLIALVTAFVFLGSMCVTPVMAETIHLDGGTVDVNTHENTTNWNVSGNPVWKVPEFNIAQGSTYNVAGLGQGSSLALLVNGGQASNIFGTMNLSNIAFILQNIAGINIGSTGLINLDKASLIASTLPLNLDATNFLAHDYQFGGQGGFLMNNGKIIGNNGDLVALISNAIENRGVIDVPTGTVALGAGSMVTVGISGDGLVSIGVDESTANDMGLTDQIKNTGTISAEGGHVILSAKAMGGLFEKAISLEQDGSALSVVKANNGSVEFISFDDFYNSGSLSAMNGHILVDSKGIITNEGTVSAINGKIEMTSGQSVYNKNLIEALGGKVEITAKNGEVKNTGTIDATKGQLQVTAKQDVTNEALMKADEGVMQLTSTNANVMNAGTLEADHGALGLTAEQSVYNKSLLEAVDGKVEISAKQGEVKNTGTIDAAAGELNVQARQDVMNQALMKAVGGEINMISTEGAIKNPGTLDATKGSIDMKAAGDIETMGNLTAAYLREKAAAFRIGGGYHVRESHHDNLDNAITFTFSATVDGSEDVPGVDGIISDVANIVINSGVTLTLGSDFTFRADSDSVGGGAFLMDAGASIAGAGHNLTLYSSGSPTLGSISNVNILSLNAQTGTATYTGSTSNDISVNTIQTTYGATLSKDVTVGSDHLIYSVSDAPGGLQYMDQNLGYNYKMANNIDASETVSWNGGLGFAPVGTSTDVVGAAPIGSFLGTFHGQNHTITGLTIARPAENFVGLFGATNGSVIRGVGIVGGSVIGGNNVGSLVGYSYGTGVEDVFASGSVSGVNNVGGLVGVTYKGSSIINSYATGVVTGTGGGAGGLVGWSNATTVTNSYATGLVTGAGTVQGGFFGVDDNNNTLSNNWWWQETGGHNDGLSDTGNRGDKSADQIDVDGTLADFYVSTHPVYLTGATEGWDFDVEWLQNAGALPTYGINPNTYLWVGTGNWSTDANWSKNGVLGAPIAGSVVGFNETSIANSSIDVGFSVAKLRIKEGYTGTITQGGSLDVTGTYVQEGGTFVSPHTETFTAKSFSVPGGAFNRFSGSGTVPDPYKIYDVYGLQGVRGYVSKDTYFELANDITILPTEVPFWNYKGSGDPLISSNYFGFDPIGNGAGNFAGDFDGASHTITGLVINRPSTTYVGLFGRANSAYIHDVGLVGGSITGGSSVGGLVGYNYQTTVKNSYTQTDVTGGEWVGGLVGVNDYNSVIDQSYATGKVANTGSGRGAGGLVGYDYDLSIITNSYATGEVSGPTDVGGLVGAIENMVSGFNCLSNNYSTGKVTGEWFTSGGLVGWFYSGISSNNYWNIETSLQADSSGETPGAIEGKTTAQMQQMTTFSAWDPGIWGLKAGVTYPVLSLHNTRWTGAGADTNWSTPENWSNNTVPDANTLVFFNNVGAAKASTIDAGFAGSVAYLGIGTGYGNTGLSTITQVQALTTGEFAQKGGRFIGADSVGLNNFVMSGGSFKAPATLNVSGSWKQTGGTFLSNSGTTNFIGIGAQTITSGGASFNILDINRTGTLQLQDALTATGQITPTSVLDVNLQTLSKGGDWYFTNFSNLRNITLTGSGQVHSAGTKFPLLSTLTISGSYTLADPITLQGSLNVTVPGGLDAAGLNMTFEKNVSITNVSNVDAVSATGLLSTISSGGRSFGSLTVSGTYTLNDALRVTNDLSVSGTLNANGQSITEGGSWYFTGLSGLGSVTLTGTGQSINTPDPLLNQFNALTITGSYSLSNAIHVNGAFVVSSGTLDASNYAMTCAGSLDLTHISRARDVTLDGGGSITSFGKAMNNLRVSGNYTLADDLHVNGWLKTDNGAATPVQTGYLHANGKNMTLARDLTIWVADDPFDLLPLPNGGDGNYQWVQRIDGFGNVTLNGFGSITSHTTELNGLTISGNYSLVDALHVNGAFSVTGNLNAASQTMTISDPAGVNLSRISSIGDVILDAASGSIRSGGQQVNNLTISGDYALLDAVHVNKALIFSGPGTLNAAGFDMTVADSLDLANISGAGNVTLDNALGGSLRSRGKHLENLTFSSGETYSLFDDIYVNKALTVTGQLDADHMAMTIMGSSGLNLTNIIHAGNVTLGGSGNITSTADSQPLDSLTITGAYTLTNALTVTNDLDIQGAGTLDANSNTITEGGDWSFAGLSRVVDVTLTGSGKTITTIDPGVNQFGNLIITGNYSLADALHVNGTLDVQNSLDAAGQAMTISGATGLDLLHITHVQDVTLGGSGSFNSHGKILSSLTILNGGDYTLAGNLAVTGDLDIQGTGKLNAAFVNTISEGGNWSFTGLSNLGDVTLTGGTVLAPKTITTGDPEVNQFVNLTISGNYTLVDAIHAAGALIMSGTGTLDAAEQAITVAGNLDLAQISRPKDVTLDGNGYLLSAGRELNNLTISGAISLWSPVRVAGILDVTETGTLDAMGENTITVAKDLDLTRVLRVGNVVLTGSGSLTSFGHGMGDLTISGAYSLTDPLYVNGEMSFAGAGTLDAATNTMTLAGSLDLTKISGVRDVILVGSGSITSFDKDIRDLTISGAYTLADALHVTRVFDVSAGNLDAMYKDMTLPGDLDLTNISQAGNVTLDGLSGWITSHGEAVRDLTINGTYSLADALHVDGALTVSGILNILGNPITLAQSLDLTKIPDAQIVTLDGSGTITSFGRSINSLTIADTGAYTLVDALTVNGNLVLQGRGTLNAASMTISERGDWSSAGFSNLGAVILSGSGKTITPIADISFGSLAITTGASYTLADGLDLVVTGDLDIQGTGTLDVKLNSISEGGNWTFSGLSNVGDVTLTGLVKTITSSGIAFDNLNITGSYTLVDALRVNGALNVTGSLNAAGKAMSLAHNLNITGLTNAGDMTLTGSGTITSGGNHFTNLTISGAYTLADPLSVTGELLIQGAGTLDATTSHWGISEGGNWVFTGLSNYGDVTLTGSGKTITSSGNAFSNLSISGSYSLVDVLHVNGALNVSGTLNATSKAMTLAQNLNLTKISNVGNVTLDGSGSITSAGKSVQGLTISGNYSLADALTTTGSLSIPGTLNAASKDISVGGDWAFLGGLSNLRNVTLTGTGKTITSGGNAFNDLTISGIYSLADALQVNGAFNVSGTLNAASQAVSVAGDWAFIGNLSNLGDVILTGSGKTITSEGNAFENLTISGTYSLNDALRVDGALNLTGTLDAANKAITLAESLDLTKITNAQDVTLTGSGSINTVGKTLDNLTVSGAYSQNSDLILNGDFTVQAGGSFTDASPLSHAFTVAGNFSVPYGTNAFRRYTGSGTVGDPFVIRTAYDLQGLKGNLASNFILSGDLNMASYSGWNDGAGFDPIGGASNSFTGSLNGNEKAISNLALNRTGSDYLGLFGNIGSGGSVSNLALEKVSIYGNNYVGGLAGLNAGSLSKVYTTGVDTVSGVDFVGGLVGSNAGSISNAYSSTHVIGTGNVGGLAGANSGAIDKTYAMGWVTGTTNAGGLVGAPSGSVTNSYWNINATGQAARGYANEGTGLSISGDTNPMMNQSTYLGWDFGSTWVMDQGGTYPHFQFQYPTGVRGVWGHVFSAPGVLAGPGISVSVYSLPAGSSTETYLDSTITDASSSYYVPLSATTVGATDSVVSYYMVGAHQNGRSEMVANSGSLYPLYIVKGENHTLVSFGPDPTPGGGVASPEIPLPPLPDYVREGIYDANKSLVDAGEIPTPLPTIAPAPNVTIEDQTGTLVRGGPSAADANSLILSSSPSSVTPLVSKPPQKPVVRSKPVAGSTPKNRTDDGSINRANISIVEKPPVGHEPVPAVTEVRSVGTDSSWRSEPGGREITTQIRMSDGGQGVEEITTDIRMNEGGSSSFESVGTDSSWRAVPLLNSLSSGLGVEEITTDIRMNEGGASSFESVGANSSRSGQGVEEITSNIRMIGAGQ